VNKMDRNGADFFAAVQMMRERLGARPVPIQVPVMVGDIFHSIIDLVEMSRSPSSRSTAFRSPTSIRIDQRPHRLRRGAPGPHARGRWPTTKRRAAPRPYSTAMTFRSALIKQAIRQGTIEDRITPVLCGSAYRNKGVRRLLDACDRLSAVACRHAARDGGEPGYPRARGTRSQPR